MLRTLRNHPTVTTAVAAAAVIALASMLTVHAGEGTAPKKKVDPKKALYTKAAVDKKMLGGVGRKYLPSKVIYPDQTIPLRFTHKTHIKEDIACTDCHDGAVTAGPGIKKSIRSKDVSLPDGSFCADCHEMGDAEAEPPGSCDTCHLDYKPSNVPDDFDHSDVSSVTKPKVKVHIPPPNLKMNHKRHIELGIKCQTCHGTMKEIDFATRENALPKMKNCVEWCHSGNAIEVTEKGKKVKLRPPKECKTCHINTGDGRLKQNYHTGKLKPAGWVYGDAHDENWLKNHRTVAQQNDEHCNNCHKPTWCVDCHNGLRKPLKVHPNNWILAHPISARKNNPDCQSCHRTQTFCLDCHNSLKVGGDTEKNPIKGNFKFHPDGWVGAPGNRSANHHAFQAKRNITACTSCHTEATCLSCHATTGKTGAGYNPHPPGFRGADCKRMMRMNPRVCAKCHVPGDPNLTSCR